ncbi:hypothetical protein TNCV_4580631 [Trichonephila clavipes]|nr:hypothetical protein TNCV_4580631 [Trichonephila clavipes]
MHSCIRDFRSSKQRCGSLGVTIFSKFAVFTFTSSTDGKRVLINAFFTLRNRLKSYGARSGECPFNHDDATNIEQKQGASPVLDVTDRQERSSSSATSQSSENYLCYSKICL